MSRRTSVRRRLWAAAVLMLVFSTQAVAQQPVEKRALTHADYDGWRSIQGQRLSSDGKFLAYALVPQDGDSELVVRNLSTAVEWRYDLGTRQQISDPDDEAEPQAGPAKDQGFQIVFTADSHNLVFQVRPTGAALDEAMKERKKAEDMPKNALGIMSLVTGEVTRIDHVKNFQVPAGAGGFVAYQVEDLPAGITAVSANGNEKRNGRGKTPGTDLVLRNLMNSTQRVFSGVTGYSIARDAGTLVYIVSSKDDNNAGLYAYTPGSADESAAVLTGKGRYSNLTWNEPQTHLAFLSDRGDAASLQPGFKLYGWDRRSPHAEELVSTATPGFKSGWAISDGATVEFSNDGNEIFFGVAPARMEFGNNDRKSKNSNVLVDLWHWKDDFIQPMQKVRAKQDRHRSYRAVYHLAQKTFVHLADETMQGLNPTRAGRLGLGIDDRPYRMLVGVETKYSDYYLVETATGARRPILEKHAGPVSWSPSGNYLLFYRDKHWNLFSVRENKIINLTQTLEVAFWHEDHDSPSEPESYGYGGWTKDEKYVLLYDKYDIWQVPVDGSAPRNLTDGIGRKEKIIFRHIDLDREPGKESGFDPAQPLLLGAVDEWTRDEGFYRDRLDGDLPQRLLMEPRKFSRPQKAKDADVFILTGSTFGEFPDLLVTDSKFTHPKKVSQANPQKAHLLWGTAELIRYKNVEGVPLSGILMKPENFNPAKKYPLMVYIYETLSENLHKFVNPAPGHSINASYYVSNGYLVLMPDIVYNIGYPGQSALNCVLPAIQTLVDQGFVDQNAIGIQGHSWGGYQIAYMLTRTNRFKAAAAGAPVANMTSAYSGIRWDTGLPRQFQYERTQSRIGATLWEEPARFLENSPIFKADRVQTPLLMMHNDGDGAVPWYQGIELYLGLRRLGKEVYMFNYNGERHGLSKRVNQKDYTRRLQQYFDHFLKGAPKSNWMEAGIPYVKRGSN